MAQLNTSTSLKVGSKIFTYANIAKNNAVIVLDAESLTIPAVVGQELWISAQAFEQNWSLVGRKPTIENNLIAVLDNNRPIVFNELRIGNSNNLLV